MKIENSGKVYVITLDHGLGYCLCKFIDYTDITPFDGGVLYVLKHFYKYDSEVTISQDFARLDILFGPVPLNKYPNIRGKRAWKFICKIEKFENKIPVFKSSDARVELYNAVDWSKVNRWSMIHNFNDSGEYCEYEKVRHLEMKTLYDMRNVEIRATMHFLILNKKKIKDYYDLADDNFRNIYLAMVNTSFDKKEALVLLKGIK